MIGASFKGSGMLVTQAKVSLETSGLATQLLKIKDNHDNLVKLIETMESCKHAIIGVVQAIQKLGFGEITCSINCCI